VRRFNVRDIKGSKAISSSIIPWVVVALLFVATSLSFLDRQLLSFAIIRIKEGIPLTDIDYSRINAAFTIGYAIMFTMGGIVIDKYGTRIGLGLSVLLWSVASALHSLASRSIHFGIFRFLLGVGEGAAFPGAIKSVIEWIPVKKRAFATGIAIGGAAIGAVVAPLMCLWLLDSAGWRVLFIITGSIGIFWTIIWFFISGKRSDKYRIHDPSVEILAGNNINGARSYSFSAIMRNKTVWIFITMRVLFDPILYFLMFWTPKFLNEYRDMSLNSISSYLWIPYLVLGLSNILGGFFSDMILAKTSSLNIARKSIMGMAAVLTISVLSIQYISSSALIIAVISLFFFAHGLWITNYVTAIGDIFGRESVSTIVGLSGTAGAISGTVSSIVIGLVVTGSSYDPLWIWAGITYPLAFIILVVFIPVIKNKDHRILS
jgi:ACS family hexuronate transporter-like MFS transporter